MGAADALTESSCRALLEKNRYNPEILPQLEAYVQAQCAGNTYDLDGNLAVLKLYQFHPETTNVSIVAKVLLKAIMRLPSTDYITCTYLIPERVQELEMISSIASLASLLETCSFRQFWTALKPLREEVVNDLPGFDDAVREFVCVTMSITYQAVPLTHLAESLDIEGAALTALIAPRHVAYGATGQTAARGWAVEGSTVKVKLNDDNQAKPKKPDEGGAIRFDQMTKILASVV